MISLVSREAYRQQMENSIVSTALSFGEIGRTAAELKMKAPVRIATSYLGKMENGSEVKQKLRG